MTTTTTPVQETSQGLAIAALICAITGLVATLTIVGSIVGVPLIIIGLVLGIISLVNNKGGKNMAWASIVIGVLAVIGMAIMARRGSKYASQIIPEIEDLAAQAELMMEQDPELKELFEDPVFMNRVENAVEQKMTEKMEMYIKDADGMPSPEDLKQIMNSSFDAFKEAVEEERERYELPSDDNQ